MSNNDKNRKDKVTLAIIAVAILIFIAEIPAAVQIAEAYKSLPSAETRIVEWS